MAWQNFSNLAGGSQPLNLFDTLAAQVASTVVVGCTASGTNTITLTPIANTPTIPVYNNYQLFSFVAANTSTGNVSLGVGALAVLNVYQVSGSQASTGTITAGTYYVVAFNSALNSNSGGFQIVSGLPSAVSTPVSVANGGTGDTSFTAYAVICGGTTTTGQLQSIAALGSAGQVLTSNGAGALPTMQNSGGGTGGTLVSIVTYTSTQTITIPATATKAWIRLVGGGGGAGSNGGGGGAAYLEKYLTSLTAGNTVALTIGAGGNNTGTNGGNSTLASGTQAITTLTAGGGQGSTAAGAAPATGGTATNGDINITGGYGVAYTTQTSSCVTANVAPAFGGDNPLAAIAIASVAGAGGSAVGFGGGGANAHAGTAGVCIIIWFT